MNWLRKKLYKFINGHDYDPKSQFSNQVSSYTPEGLYEIYLFDFKNYQSEYYSGNLIVANPSSNSGEVDLKSQKIQVKPIDVLNELERVVTPFSLVGLDEKIEVLKLKEKLIVQTYSKREISALIDRLENRKRYQEFKSFFDRFDNTTDEKINNLLEKYDLVMKTSDLFIPEFPDEAIKVIMEYTETVEKICGKKPLFYVIATSDNFKTVEKQRDPILLVQSPFGFYWQILGAWDKEMLILSEF